MTTTTTRTTRTTAATSDGTLLGGGATEETRGGAPDGGVWPLGLRMTVDDWTAIGLRLTRALWTLTYSRERPAQRCCMHDKQTATALLLR